MHYWRKRVMVSLLGVSLLSAYIFLVHSPSPQAAPAERMRDKLVCRYVNMALYGILAEGAIALAVALSGGALFASGKLLRFPSSTIVKVMKTWTTPPIHIYIYTHVYTYMYV